MPRRYSDWLFQVGPGPLRLWHPHLWERQGRCQGGMSESAIRVDQPDPCFIGTVEVVFTREEYAVDQTFKDSCSMEEQSRK